MSTLVLRAGLPEEGSRVIVYWPGAEGKKWHHGRVKDIDDNGRSTVAYDDGDREVLHFAVERFKLEEGTPPPGMHCHPNTTQNNAELVSVQKQLVFVHFATFSCSTTAGCHGFTTLNCTQVAALADWLV